MEEDSKSTVNNSRYFEELLTRIREIRASERSAIQKISDVIASNADYNGTESLRRFSSFAKQLGEQGSTERFANKLLLYAEISAKQHKAIFGRDIEKLAHQFLNDRSFKQNIYDYPSFQGVSDEDEMEVCLPEELQNFKGSSMVLKIEDMDRLIDTFCSRNTYYKRAYAILADLDKKVLDCVETGVFPWCILMPYKEEGDAIFEFSHFECDLREPDNNYRTLFVVYRYDTTIS